MCEVNLGAIVSANKNIYVWGKLLGISLVGDNGNKNASIASLFLSLQQLRVCEIVAIGSKGNPKKSISRIPNFGIQKNNH